MRMKGGCAKDWTFAAAEAIAHGIESRADMDARVLDLVYTRLSCILRTLISSMDL